MKKLRILIDIDGIVADTIPHWLHNIGVNTGIYATLEHITEYDLAKCPPLTLLASHQIFDVLQQPGFTLSTPMMSGAAPIVKALMEDGHEVYLVTARSGAQHITETFRWIEKELPFIDIRKQLAFLHNKHIIEADVIIDDRGETLTNYKHEHPHALTIAIEYPYNTYLRSSDEFAARDVVFVQPGENAWISLYSHIVLHASK